MHQNYTALTFPDKQIYLKKLSEHIFQNLSDLQYKLHCLTDH